MERAVQQKISRTGVVQVMGKRKLQHPAIMFFIRLQSFQAQTDKELLVINSAKRKF